MNFLTKHISILIVGFALILSVVYLAEGYPKINTSHKNSSKLLQEKSSLPEDIKKLPEIKTEEQELLSFIVTLRQSVGWDFVKMKNYGQDRFLYQFSSYLSLGHSTVTCLPATSADKVTNVLLKNGFVKEDEAGDKNFNSGTFRKDRAVCKVIVGPCHDQEFSFSSNEEKKNLYFSCTLLPEESEEELKKKSKVTNIRDIFDKISKILKLSFTSLKEDGFVWGATKHNPNLEQVEMSLGFKLKGPGLTVDCVGNSTLAMLKKFFNDEGFEEGESYWVASGWASKEYFNRTIGCIIDYDMCTRPRHDEVYEDLANFSIRCGYFNTPS